jgi:hypothetical protein
MARAKGSNWHLRSLLEEGPSEEERRKRKRINDYFQK